MDYTKSYTINGTPPQAFETSPDTKSPTKLSRRAIVVSLYLSMSYNNWGPPPISRGKTALNFTQVNYTAIPILSSIFWTLEILFLGGLSPWWGT